MRNNDLNPVCYYETKIVDYDNNPMIEALPPLYSFKQVNELLTVYPNFQANERDDETELRFHYIQRLFDYFQPLSQHFSLERKLSTVIRQGYINRNPLDKNHVKYLNNSYLNIKNGQLPNIDRRNIKKRVQGFSIIGMSGTGKTSGIDRVLNMYEQVIFHQRYKEQDLMVTQIPWLKIECPADGSTKGLCINFFQQLDDILDSNYLYKYQNKTQDIMLSQMGHLSRLLNIGVLIVDEIQHLSLQKSGGANKMLNFFVTLVNSIGVPVILIGTNKAFDLLNGEFRQARRGVGQGSEIWDKLENDSQWEIFINGLLRYQWTRNTVIPTKELKDIIYNESQGIVDIAVKLFAITQMEVIVNGTETITGNSISKAANKYLKSLQPMLSALKSGDFTKMSRYEDLKPNLTASMHSIQADLTNYELIKLQKSQLKQQKVQVESAIQRKVIEKINDLELVKRATQKILNSVNYSKYELNELIKLTTETAESMLSKKGKNKKTKIKFSNNDLRKIHQNSIEKKVSVYTLLKENDFFEKIIGYEGVIK